jgi:FAD synthetase
MRTVLVAGTFDILHPGHNDFFSQAKIHGDRLVVIVARDSTVLRVKGKAAHHDEKTRLAAVAANPLVDKARLGNEGDLLTVVHEEKPDVICLGYDQKMDGEELKQRLSERGLFVNVIRLDAHKPEVYKSSILRKSRNAQ